MSREDRATLILCALLSKYGYPFSPFQGTSNAQSMEYIVNVVDVSFTFSEAIEQKIGMDPPPPPK